MAGNSKPTAIKVSTTNPAEEILATGSVTLTGGTSTAATGTVTLDTGASGSVDGILVDSVEIMSGAESFDTSLSITATNVAANITANTSSPNYTADAVGAVITITAAINAGAGPNTFTVVSSVTTITKTDVNMASGVTATVTGILVNSIEIMSGTENFTTDLNTTATNIAANITANTSSPDYNAAAVGAIITITATASSGSGANGFVVVASGAVITTTDVNMSGGVSSGEVNEAVPAGVMWDIDHIVIKLTASGASANRLVSLIITDDTDEEIYKQVIGNAITASQVAKIFCSKFGGTKPADTTLERYLNLPDVLELPAGWKIKTSTANLEEDDDFLAPIVVGKVYQLATN